MMENTKSGRKRTIVGLGELLWDLLPNGKQLGGAPANFAFITSLLGDEGVVASRIGDDDLGNKVLHRLSALKLNAAFVQRDQIHPTGSVHVQIDSSGQPQFEIAESVAWDYLEWTCQWQTLAQQADAVCFGSLAQRSATSRSTIRQFVQAMRDDMLRIFDVNLRQSFFTPEILADSMRLADIVKLNHEELPRIMGMFDLTHVDEQSSARRLLALHNLKLVCVTRGCRGSLLVSQKEWSEHPGFEVKVADTVGAGDAFTAAIVHQYLRSASLRGMGNMANKVGAWVASQVGATAAPRNGDIYAAIDKMN